MPFHESLQAHYTPEIVAPVDGGDLMLAGASYVFWPVLPLAMLFTSRREQPYMRFHFLQSLAFGAITSFAFALFTVILLLTYRGVGSTESLWVGAMLVGLFVGWLLGLLFCFMWLMIFAWRAGRGEVFRMLVVGSMIENRVLSSMRPWDGLETPAE